jgi:hypothetical protein
MVPACGSWRRDGIAWAFRLETGFGRGRIFSWKPACKSGRTGTVRMRFTCSHQIARSGKRQMSTDDKIYARFFVIDTGRFTYTGNY